MGDQVKAKAHVVKTVCGKCGLQFNETEVEIHMFDGPFNSADDIDKQVATVRCPKCHSDNIIG